MSSAKRARRSAKDSAPGPEPEPGPGPERSMLMLMEEKLKPLESLKKLDILDTLRAEVAELKDMVRKYKTESDELQQTVSRLRSDVQQLQAENSELKAAVGELQTGRDNLIFSGIDEAGEDSPEDTLRTFLTAQMRVPEDTVDTLTFSRVHRLGTKRTGGPRPIVAKFEYLEQRQLVLGLQKTLLGTRFGISEHFPPSSMDGRKSPQVQNLPQASSTPAVQQPQMSDLKPEVSYGPEALVIQTDSNKYSAIAVKDGAVPQTSEAACDFNAAPNAVATLTHVGWLCGDTVYLNNDQVPAPSPSALPQNYSSSRRGRKPKHLQGTLANTGRTGQEAIPGPSSCEATALTTKPPCRLTVGTSNRHQERDEVKQPAKRPLNAYGVFVREQRESIRAEFNVTNVADVNKILGAKWRALSMHEQFQYYTIAHRESDLGSQ